MMKVTTLAAAMTLWAGAANADGKLDFVETGIKNCFEAFALASQNFHGMSQGYAFFKQSGDEHWIIGKNILYVMVLKSNGKASCTYANSFKEND